MVGVARGTASSSMKIKGTLDTGDIDRGFARVGKGFEGVKGQSKSFTSDMQRMSITTSNLAKKFLLMGVAGVSAITAIASKAPAVAPALAKMSVSFGKITRSLGEALAPAFEKVAGWLEKLAVWIGNNKEKISEVATKFLDLAEAVGKKVLPYLEKIGQWAMDHPNLFAGIVAGLALAPSVIAGISTVSGIIKLMTGSTISASVLTALGYIALIGGGSFAAAKGIEAAVGKAYEYAGAGSINTAPGMSGETVLERIPQKAIANMRGRPAPWEDPTVTHSPANVRMAAQISREISEEGYKPKTGMISEAETRRGWFLQWWDATWG